MCSDPLGKIVGPARNFSVKPYPGHAAEITLTWGRRLAYYFEYQPEINGTNVGSAIEKFLPRRERVAYAAQFQSPREVVATAARNDQNRRLQIHKGRKMAMNRTISSKNYGYVGLIGKVERPDRPISAAHVPEFCEILLEIPRSEDGRSAHALRI